MKEIFKKYKVIIAIVVWIIAALPFIKIFLPAKSTSNPLITINGSDTGNIKESQQEFELFNNYGDPFLKHNVRTKPVISSGTNSREPQVKKNKSEAKPIILNPKPAIIYTGIIKNKQNSKVVGLFTINGNDALLAVNQQHEGITLLKLFNDSALVQYEKEKLFVRK